MDLKQMLFGKNKTLGRSLTLRTDLYKLTGTINSALFLSQVAYWWFANGRKPFYKFNGPCQHSLCRTGDTWADEFPFGRDAFERARSQVATKVTQGTSKKEARQTSLILYWTDSNRVTWYELNETLLLKWIKRMLGVDNSSPKNVENATHPHYLESGKTRGTCTSNPTTNNNNLLAAPSENQLDIKNSEEPDWWQAALRELRGQMTRATYERLLLGSQARYEAPGALIVAVKDRSAAIHLERLSARISAAVVAFGKGEVDQVKFIGG